MREKTTAPSASRRPATSRDYGDDGLFQRVVRRLRDLLIMGVVGPVDRRAGDRRDPLRDRPAAGQSASCRPRPRASAKPIA